MYLLVPNKRRMRQKTHANDKGKGKCTGRSIACGNTNDNHYNTEGDLVTFNIIQPLSRKENGSQMILAKCQKLVFHACQLLHLQRHGHSEPGLLLVNVMRSSDQLDVS